jgi:hypothetical protein
MATARAAAPRAALRAWAREPAVRDAWLAFWTSRAVVWGAGVAAVAALGVIDANATRFDPEGLTRPFGALVDDLVAPGARWDAAWYLRIAEDGYGPEPARAAFFPLYPLLVAAGGLVAGSPLLAGIAISLACLFGALVLLHRLVALDFGRDVARLTVLLVALLPGAVWFSSVYSEALFLWLSVGAVYAARVDRWALAGVAGVLAAATRSAGVLLLVPLAVLWWRSARRPRDLAWVLATPLGVVAFCAWIAVATDHGVLAPFEAQEAWLRSFAGPFGAVPDAVTAGWEGARDVLTGAERPAEPFDPALVNAGLLLCLVAVAVALGGALWRLPRAYSLYALAALALPLSYPVDGQPLMSLPRFAAVLWPLHLWLALVLARRPVGRPVALALAGSLLALTSAHVARWGWVA